MFRRFSFAPRALRTVKSRLFSEQQSLYEKSAPKEKSKAQKIVEAGLNITLVLLVTGNVVSMYWVHTLFNGRKFVTDADMHEYRSQHRNTLRDIPNDEERRKFLMKEGLEHVDKKVLDIAKSRKPQLPTETVAAYEKQAGDEFWDFLWSGLSFNSEKKGKNMDNFVRFYYTYEERAEEKKRLAIANGTEWTEPVEGEFGAPPPADGFENNDEGNKDGKEKF
eukprot:CAMPEP_0184968068 /NCGR_PEP_ID=MMETSP1098-20130426/1234_1 /TAXON_ID=89044 /ORGANISM="Spumella elongata, Strain CCAP 955/1" /LENGTH=220 /DNA_ID=CAMNT_0027489623 /DNA_START=33 /DNA_END=695 /DNA_ORIENTATION=-